MTAPARLPRRIALSYSVGAVGTGVFSTVPGLLLLYYLTDVVGVGAGLAAVVLFLPKLWDALLNPVVGTLSDRTSTRWGGRRPYLLAGAVVVPVMFALLFSSPDLGSPGRTAVYVGVVYTLAMTGYALFQVPWVAMPAEMTSDYHERTRLMSSRMVLLTVGILLGGAVAPLISGGKEGGRSGYALMSVVIAVVLAAALLTAWWGTRDAAFSAPDTSPRPTVRAQLALVRSNGPFVQLFLAYALQSVAIGAMLAGAPYVATYVLGDAALSSVLFVFLVVPSAVVMPLWRRFSIRTSKSTGYVLASTLFGLTALTLVLAQSAPKPLVFLQMGLLGVGYAGMQLFPYAMLPDALTLTGSSRAGVFTGVWQGGETVGFALGPALYGGLLALTGFVSSAADERVDQPDSAVTGLVLGFSVLPAVLVLLSVPLLRRYAATDARLSAQHPEEVPA
ncbi:MAG: major facilitator transporter [Frankiales bacterium]|nr:major facilitator transporter [Frankiales bacterium]